MHCYNKIIQNLCRSAALPLMQSMAGRVLGLCLLLWVVAAPLRAQNIPEPMQPYRLVNDFAGMLSPAEQQALEGKLRAYLDSTSTQVYVVSLVTTDGYTLAQLSPLIFEKWGIGQKDINNGVLILLKPKREREAGELFIGTGYGMEGVLPDIYAKRIVDQIMIPYLKEGNTYAAIDGAIDAIAAYAGNEYKAVPKKADPVTTALWVVVVFVIAIIIIRAGKNSGKGGSGSGCLLLPFMLLFGGGGGGRSGRGDGGGFGGGGGGMSGGGGAGGRW